MFLPADAHGELSVLVSRSRLVVWERGGFVLGCGDGWDRRCMLGRGWRGFDGRFGGSDSDLTCPLLRPPRESPSNDIAPKILVQIG